MKFLILVLLMSISVFSHVPSPDGCSGSQLEAMGEFYGALQANGLFDKMYQLGLGSNGGICNDHYSLDRAAEIPHKTDAPPPSCGIVFTLSHDPEEAKSQAIWLLQNIGKTFVGSNNSELSMCSRIMTTGPLPGAGVHN